MSAREFMKKTQTDMRKKVSILFLNKPDMEELGFKYLVLSLNKIQTCFEFEFPNIEDD